MGKKKRLFIAISALTLVGGLLAVGLPRECDYSINNKLTPAVWAVNAWARMVGRSQNCDPWDRVSSHRPIGAITISFAINAYAGPSFSDFYVQPDGRGYVYRFSFDTRLSPPASAEDALLKLADGRYPDSFTFNDPAVYSEVRRLVSPLRQATGEVPREYMPMLSGIKDKVRIPCKLEGYHSAYNINWEPRPFVDFSYFDNSSAREGCLASRAARVRLEKAIQLMRSKVPTAFTLRWYRDSLATNLP